MLTETTTRLNAATVKETVGDRIRLALPNGDAWARLALAYPYEPAEGDVVLTITEDETYIIGVLQGRGKTVFRAPGDFELIADGHVDIVGRQGIQLRSENISMEADRIETTARTAFEKLVDSYRWVKGVIQTRAGRTRTQVNGTATVQAERIVQSAEKDVKIDGKKIHLG